MKSTNNNKGLDPKSNQSLAKQDEQNSQELSIEIPESDFTFPDSTVYVDTATHKLCAYDAFNVPYVISDEIHLRRVCKNLDSDSVRITLKHITKWVNNEIEIKLEDLRSSRLYDVLAGKGVNIYEGCIRELAFYLFEQVQSYIDQYGYRYEHYRLGWGKNSRNSGFFASKSIKAPYFSTMWNNEEKILGPCGDQQKYDDMVKSEIIPHKSMHLPFVLGFTAPIIPLICHHTDTPVVLVNFAGKSSMGKTTSMKLIASIWGRGKVSNKRLSICKTFSCTENGFEACISQNKGVPALFDDFQAATEQKYFSDLVYRLTQGESKIRCNKKGRTYDTYDWSTFLAFSGEHSLFDYVKKDSGLKARIVQFQNVQWTASEQNVIGINSVIKDNYGFYGELFVSKLMSKTDDELLQYYEESKAVIDAAFNATDNATQRLYNRYSIIRMTAVLVKELINPDIDVDYITKFLIDTEKAREAQLSLFEEAREILVEFINKNLPNFVRKGIDLQYVVIPNSRIVGRIYTGKQGKLIAILPDEFKKIMMRFGDHDLILETWRKEGFLVTESETRFTKKVKISNFVVAPRCYVFLFDDFEQLFGKLLNLEEIDMQDLDEEDFVANLAKDPKNIITRRDPNNKNVKRKYVAIPDVPTTEVVKRFTKEAHDEYVQTEPVATAPIVDETPIANVEYDDKEAINAIFEEDDSDEEN